MIRNEYIRESFTIGKAIVYPPRNLIVFNGKKHKLPPKSFSVLLILYDNAGNVVTRDQLFDKVWGGAFVSEAVLNRAISQLRKALGDNPENPSVIETVPRIGYRLVGELIGSMQPQPFTQKLKSLLQENKLVSLLYLSVLVTGIIFYLNSEPDLFPISFKTQPTQITFFSGEEFEPAIHADSGRLTYVRYAVGEGNFYFIEYQKDIEGPFLKIKIPDTHLRLPTWSTDGSQILFSALKEGEYKLHLFDLESEVISPIFDMECICWGEPVWSQLENIIAFSDVDQDTPEGARAIFLMDGIEYTPKRLTFPGIAEKDVNPNFSEDGKSLYFIRISKDSEQLLQVDLETGDTKPIKIPPAKIFDFASGPDGNSIFLSDNGVVFQIKPGSKNEPALVWGRNISNLATAPSLNEIYMAQEIYDVNLWGMDLNNLDLNPKPMFQSTLVDSLVSLNSDATVISYTSIQPRKCEVFVSKEGRREKVLNFDTVCTASHWPKVSPDGTTMAYTQQENESYSILVMDLETKNKTIVAKTQQKVRNLQWVAGRNFLIFSMSDPKEEIWGIDLETETGAYKIIDGKLPRTGPEGKLYYEKATEPGIWKFDFFSPSSKPEFLTVLPDPLTKYWTPTERGIFFITVESDAKGKIILFVSETGTSSVLGYIPRILPADVRFQISLDGSLLVYTKLDYAGQDIWKLTY